MIQATLYVILDIDECALGEDDCHENAICSDIVGGSDSFQCACTTGYTGNGVICTSKKLYILKMHWCMLNMTLTADIDECNLGTHDCAVDAMCTDSNGSYTCTCNTGYAGDGKTCTSTYLGCDINC